ncbi:MAG TPA: fumarylacetoacetase [Bryobacteraceae bacterium]|nr:fumarylacetoacetase [Bryobacteraceae bacterium]
MIALNETHNPARRSWVPGANVPDGDFPVQNLPFGIFRTPGREPRGGVAIGGSIFDLGAGLELGLFTGITATAARAASGATLNPLMALGADAASALRARLSDLLSEDGAERHHVEVLANRFLVPMTSTEMLLPVQVGNFTDFMTSSFHASRVTGRPLDAPLPPVVCHMPVAYHGRASSVRISGEEVRRPNGQSKPRDGSLQFGPSQALDFELEFGAFIAQGNALGSPIALGEAPSKIFGYCLLNDWSARDIQSWESMLGPFLSKSLSTTISPWVVTAEALAPFRAPVFVPRPDWPATLPYLDSEVNRAEGGLDVDLEASLQTTQMRDSGAPPARVAATNVRYLCWTFVQMVTHHSSNGCNLQPGDLLGSGTVSGPTDDSRGCLLEYTEPLQLPNGEIRRYLEDGDEVIFRGRARREGYVTVGFGECRARIAPAPPWSSS